MGTVQLLFLVVLKPQTFIVLTAIDNTHFAEHAQTSQTVASDWRWERSNVETLLIDWRNVWGQYEDFERVDKTERTFTPRRG